MTTLSHQQWLDAGATPFMAEAFVDLEFAYESYLAGPAIDTLDKVLQWHGICGFTHQIMDTAETLGWEQLDVA